MPNDYRYDVFISYRRADRDLAITLLRQLEAEGYRAAIDERDFAGNETFLEEMERCVKQSRYTACVITSNYFQSGNTVEEAIICKVLDMSERRRRLLPLIVEKADMPTWLYNITGIDYTAVDPIMQPFDRLKFTIGKPLGRVP